MKDINYASIKLEEKATRSFKNNKKYFINIIGNLPWVLDEYYKLFSVTYISNKISNLRLNES